MDIEFEFNSKRNLIKFCGEYTGIFMNRHKILKKKKGKAKNYNHNKTTIKVTTILFGLWLLSVVIYVYDMTTTNFQEVLISSSTLFLIMATIFLATWIFSLEKTYKELLKMLNQKGVLTISDDKITCNYNEREISTTLEKINGIILGKYSLNIITENNIVFNIPITIKDKVINTLKKYKNNILIIELK